MRMEARGVGIAMPVNLDQLTDAVMEKLDSRKPRVLLIGDLPKVDHNYNYVKQKPYEAVVLGVLTPAQLLHMPSDHVCEALLEEMPVYFWPNQPWKKAKTAKALCRELLAAEQRLYRLGVLPVQGKERLITAAQARSLRQQGRKPPEGSRLTPLAKDVLEGKEP